MIAIQQTVDISAGREIVLKLPETAPVGRVTITVSIAEAGKDAEPVIQNAVASKFGVVSAENLKKLVSDNSPSKSATAISQPLDYRDAQIAIAFARGKTHEGKSYIKYAGCLKDSPVFKGDPVTIQKEMRSEWD